MEPKLPSELKYNISKSVFFDGLITIKPSEPMPIFLSHKRLINFVFVIGNFKDLLSIIIKSLPVP